jgi:hypothetical protein
MRDRRRPLLYTPPPTSVRSVVKRHKHAKHKKGFVPNPSQRVPPWDKAQRQRVVTFLDSSFGRSVINEDRLKDNDFYQYWSSYARSDFERSATFEKRCFICYCPVGDASTPEEVKDDFIPCSIAGCPKVYHKSCLTGLYLNYTVTEDTFICPWHHCSECGGLGLFMDKTKQQECQRRTGECGFRALVYGGNYCPTCIQSYCGLCSGFEFAGIIDSPCIGCTDKAIALDAPEMLMDLTSYLPCK